MRSSLALSLVWAVLATPAAAAAQQPAPDTTATSNPTAGAAKANSTAATTAESAQQDPRLAPPTEWKPATTTDPRLAPPTEWKPATTTDPRLAPPTEWRPAAPSSTYVPATQAATPSPDAGRGTLGPVHLQWGGAVQSEIHYRTAAKKVGSFYDQRELEDGFVRNENTLRLELTARMGGYSGVADIDFDWVAMAEPPGQLTALTYPERVSPYRLEAHALYLEATDVLFSGLDLRIGQQLVQWGVGDQFNPTNTINPNDLENILFFGRQVANQMVRADYALAQTWSVSGVLVPLFKPAVLPASAPLGMSGVDRLPFLSEELRWKLHAERELGAQNGYPTVVSGIEPKLPEASVKNMQWALRLAGSVLDQDVALSYYNGRADIPVATKNVVHQTTAKQCDASGECIKGLLQTDVTVSYPREQVVGLNMDGEINPLGWISHSILPIGYRIEVGVYIPRQQRFRIEQQDIELAGQVRDGEYPYNLPDGKRPLVIDDTPFAKWVVGLDYTFNRHAYANVMWVHGMVDELGAGDFLHEGYSVRQGGIAEESNVGPCVFGAASACERAAVETLRPRLGDYAVVGLDLHFADSQGLLRLFTVWDLSGIDVEQWDEGQQKRVRTHYAFYEKKAFSAAIFPQLEYNFGNGLVLAGGALIQLGKDYTKFGDPAAGGTLAWGRATFSF